MVTVLSHKWQWFKAEIKRRQMIQVATVYAVSAWPLIQIADLSVPALGLPDSVMTLLLQIFIAGFPVSLILAWLFNVTDHGIVRVRDGDDPESQPKANKQTYFTVAGCLVLVLLITLGSQMMLEEQTPQPPVANVADNVVTPPTIEAVEDTKPSIAILPFIPFSADPEDEFFADGMVEELLNAMAKLPELRVAARTSSFAYKDVTNKTITEIATELGVNHILEGSIRKNDTTNKVRVTAQLIRGTTGERLWSETYDREYQDIFQIQEDIANAVVDKMSVTILGKQIEEQLPIQFSAPTSSVDAMVAYGKGQKELGHRTVISINNALAHFSEAIRLDPDYARAYVGIADAHTLLALYGNVPIKDAYDIAHQSVDKALAIDDQLGEAYATRGLLLRGTDHEKAEVAFKKAMELNPNYAPAFMWYGGMLEEQGELEKGYEMYEQAFKLDPKSPVAAFLLAKSYYSRGNEAKTMELFSHIVANDPYYPGAYNLVGKMLLTRGRLDEAITMFKRALDVDALNKGAVSGLIAANTDLGNHDRSLQWFDYARKHDEMFDSKTLNLMRFQHHISQGNKHQAFDYLDQVSFEPEHGHGYKNDMFEGQKAYYQGNFQLAVEALERLRHQESMSEDSFYRIHGGRTAAQLAYAYQQLEMTDKLNELLVSLENYLSSNKEKKINDPSYYYTMSLVKTIQGKSNEAFYYLQGAIDVGWVRAWEAEIEPIMGAVQEDIQFTLMLGGVKARLANMRVRMSEDEEFLLEGSEEI